MLCCDSPGHEGSKKGICWDLADYSRRITWKAGLSTVRTWWLVNELGSQEELPGSSSGHEETFYIKVHVLSHDEGEKENKTNKKKMKMQLFFFLW